MTLTFILWVLAACISLASAYLWIEERRSRDWPTAIATVVEVPPQTLFERNGRWWAPNLDSDHQLQWVVSGRTFTAPRADNASVSVNGLKLWRRKPSGTLELRYDPANPSKHWLLEEDRSWRTCAVIAAFLSVGALIAAVA
jgi:hypothetical protein